MTDAELGKALRALIERVARDEAEGQLELPPDDRWDAEDVATQALARALGDDAIDDDALYVATLSIAADAIQAVYDEARDTRADVVAWERERGL